VTEVVVSTVIDAPVEAVWSRLADFTAWHEWLPRIVATTMESGNDQGAVGSVRTLRLSDGKLAREQLVSRDDAQCRMSYRFVGPAPFAVRSYTGCVRAQPITTSGASFVRWSGEFDADADAAEQLSATFSSLYRNFLDALGTAVRPI
jgi:hypothetical protein